MSNGIGIAHGIGLSEQELRERLEQELVQAMRAEGGVPTIHAIAHSIARVLTEDHLRIAEQLQQDAPHD
jgi:hypothetical protein